jgi:hypothetical protein
MPDVADAIEQAPLHSDPGTYPAEPLTCPDRQHVGLKLLGNLIVRFGRAGGSTPGVDRQLSGLNDASSLDPEAVRIHDAWCFKAIRPSTALPVRRHVEVNDACDLPRTAEKNLGLATAGRKRLQLSADACGDEEIEARPLAPRFPAIRELVAQRHRKAVPDPVVVNLHRRRLETTRPARLQFLQRRLRKAGQSLIGEAIAGRIRRPGRIVDSAT